MNETNKVHPPICPKCGGQESTVGRPRLPQTPEERGPPGAPPSDIVRDRRCVACGVLFVERISFE